MNVPVTLLANQTFSLSNNFNFGMIWDSPIQLGAHTLTLAALGLNPMTVRGAIAGAGQVRKTGPDLIHFNATNAYAGQNNPYTQQAVDYATGDLNRAYANNVAPRFAGGSSFGSSGLGFAEVQARDDLLRRQGQMSNDMRSKDLFAQQQLGESGAARQDSINNLLSQLGVSGASVLGNLGSQDAQRADSMYTNNANRYLTGAGQIASNSQIPVGTATTIANAQGNLWGLNNNNTNQATEAYRWGQDYPMRQQEMLVNSIGRGGQNTSTTTPNCSAASRFVGGTLAGWQGWNNLTQQRGSSNTGRTAT